MPSKEHNALAERPYSWIRNRATMKGIRGHKEIGIAPGYVADAVYLCSYQNRFWEKLKHKDTGKLLQLMRRIHINTYQKDFKSWSAYWEARAKEQGIFTAGYNSFACIFEIKVSLQDFRRTFGYKESNRLTPAGSLHWVVGPLKAIDQNILPEFWGILIPSGRGLREYRKPLYCEQPDSVMYKFSHTILWTNLWNRQFAKGHIETGDYE